MLFVFLVSSLFIDIYILNKDITFIPSTTSPLSPEDNPNVILIVMDTVRAKELSLYGYPKKTSPNIDKFAEIQHIDIVD